MVVLKYLLIGIISIIAIVLIIALFVPKQYKVVRSVTIGAPQTVIMDQVKSLRKMNEWSPFIEQDPNIQITYGGTEGQVGSSSSWKSDKAGEGTQTITKMTSDRIETALHFKKPMKSTSNAYLQTTNVNGGVEVTWGMHGENPYPFNVMCLFMDNLIGKDYEKGLANLKTKCEKMKETKIVTH